MNGGASLLNPKLEIEPEVLEVFDITYDIFQNKKKN